MKPIHDMPSLCTVVLSALWAEDDLPSDDEHSNSSTISSTTSTWESQRQLDFMNYCHTIFSQLNVSCSVIYTSLKYIQNYLERTNQKPAYGAERAIFMVALLLAYKFVEDCGTLDATVWARASMIPVPMLVKLEK
ncbi:hypothetical protein BCR43DRAFT_564836, partial [Syncephalastrum racemosum]